MKLNLNELKGVETQENDLTEYEGKKVKIESIDDEAIVTHGKYGEQVSVRILTEPITTFQTKDGNEIQVRGSELFNLKQTEDGSWDWSKSPKAKIMKFMKKQGVNKLLDLIGTIVMVKIRTKKTDEGEKQYFGFVTE